MDLSIRTRASTTVAIQLITSLGSLASGWALFFRLLLVVSPLTMTVIHMH